MTTRKAKAKAATKTAATKTKSCGERSFDCQTFYFNYSKLGLINCN
jgi:hypothetical protein